MLENFIKSNFDVIIGIQEKFDHDTDMIEAVENRTLTNDMVKTWMRNYGLFQGIKNEFRIGIANAFIEFCNELDLDKEPNIETSFLILHSKFFSIYPRKWLSATSKLLWCIYP